MAKIGVNLGSGGKKTQLDRPLGRLLDQALAGARFAKKYWASSPERPGLDQCGAALDQDIAQQLLDKRKALQAAETQVLHRRPPPSPLAAQLASLRAAASFVLRGHKTILGELRRGLRQVQQRRRQVPGVRKTGRVRQIE